MSSPRTPSPSPASSLPNMSGWKLSPANSQSHTPHASPLRRAIYQHHLPPSSLSSSPAPKTHIVITNEDGSIFEGDFTYSRPGTLPHTPHDPNSSLIHLYTGNPHAADSSSHAAFLTSVAAILAATAAAQPETTHLNINTDSDGEQFAGLLSTALRPAA